MREPIQARFARFYRQPADKELFKMLADGTELVRYKLEQVPDKRIFTFLADGEAEQGHLSYGDLDREARAIACGCGRWPSPASEADAWQPPAQPATTLYPSCSLDRANRVC
jgi:hypothetical protein